MKILYLTSMRLPSPMAHAIQVMKVCESLGVAGHDVTLFCTAERGVSKLYPSQYFGIRPGAFRAVTIPALSSKTWLPLRYKAHLAYHALATFLFSLFSRADVYYTRDILPALVATLLPGKTILEVHDMPSAWVRLNALVYGRVDLIVSTTEWTKRNLVEKLRIDPKKIVVENNGVDFETFASSTCDMSVREECVPGSPQNKIVMYTGHLYDWKGAHVLAETATILPPSVQLVFVGGSGTDTEKFRERFGTQANITILGHKAYRDIPRYMACADAFVLPNVTEGVSNANHSRNATSPVKLFEYLSCGKRIIASDLPSIRELVPEKFCVFVPQNNPAVLADAIAHAVDTTVSTDTVADMKKFAQEHSWLNRSQRVLQYMETLSTNHTKHT